MMPADDLSQTFSALADPTRRAILERLAAGDASVNELAKPFAMSLPGISKHLKVLERAGLITRGRQAQQRPCRLDTQRLQAVANWVAQTRGLWDDRFQQLGSFLAELQTQEPTMSDSNENTVVSSRVFAAPRERVFDAFADPTQLHEWWGPNGFTTTIHEMDFQAGGAFRLTLHGPDGANYVNEKKFVEVVRPSKIVFDHFSPMHDFRMTMQFDEANGGTNLTWRMHFTSAEQFAKIKDFIAEKNEENFDRLAAFLAESSR